MAEQRVVRSKEERKAEIEKKIQFHKDCIKTLEQKIHDIDNPKKQRYAQDPHRGQTH